MEIAIGFAAGAVAAAIVTYFVYRNNVKKMTDLDEMGKERLARLAEQVKARLERQK